MRLAFTVLIIGLLLALSFPVAADTFGGVPGQDYGNYSATNTHAYSDWPPAYSALCEQHMRAVIKRCSVDAAEKGYDNWLVTRGRASQTFSPSRGFYDAEDIIFGGNSSKCAYNENTDDEVYISNVILTFMCSKDQDGENVGSSQFACNFSCAAWDCEEDVDEYSISACGGSRDFTGTNPFISMTIGCQEQTQELCAARGTNCQLEQPCYYYDYDRRLVHCDCSCAGTDDAATLTAEQLAAAQSEPFNLDTFNFTQWKQDNPGPCDPVISNVNDDDSGGFLDGLETAAVAVKDAGGSVIGFITNGVKTILDKSTLPFSKIGGIFSASKNGNVIVVGSDGTASNASRVVSTESSISNLVAGTNAALPYAAATNSYNLLGPSTAKQEVAEKTENACPLPSCGGWGTCTSNVQTRICQPVPSGCAAPAATQSCACQENWSCGEYSATWSAWSACQNNIQSHTRTRTCTDANNCGTTAQKPIETETQTQACETTPTPPPASCTESWSCDPWGEWSSWGECQSNSTQTRTHTRACTDANACGTTANRPILSDTETQSCTYTPPASYHEKTEYLNVIANGATTLTLGQSQTWNLNANETKVYVFSLSPTITYDSFVQVTSGAGLGFTLQQRYGPPQLTYVDPSPGHSQFSNGPTMVGSDVQRVAITVGPAEIASGGTIIITQV